MRLTKELYEELEKYFMKFTQQVEDGGLAHIDLAVYFHDEMKYLSTMLEHRKMWLNQNADTIADECEGYGPDGYKGLIFKAQTRETLSYKHIPKWWSLEQQQKEIEEQSKFALRLVRKGGLNVTPDGEEIPLPEVKTSSFLRTEKAPPPLPRLMNKEK